MASCLQRPLLENRLDVRNRLRPIPPAGPIPDHTRSRDTRETLDSRQKAALYRGMQLGETVAGPLRSRQSCAMLDAAQRREAPPQAAWRRVGPPASPRPDPKIKFHQILFLEQILLMTYMRPTPRSHWLLDELLVVGETRPTTLLFADPPTRGQISHQYAHLHTSFYV